MIDFKHMTPEEEENILMVRAEQAWSVGFTTVDKKPTPKPCNLDLFYKDENGSYVRVRYVTTRDEFAELASGICCQAGILRTIRALIKDIPKCLKAKRVLKF